MKQQAQMSQQLCCSICISTFINPVTIQCGHSFCRFCILNFTHIKLECPICRSDISQYIIQISSVSQTIIDDSVLTQLTQYQKKLGTVNKKQKQNSRNQVLVQGVEKLILLDIRSQSLLFPSTKITATFELQHQNLLQKLQRFVARQEAPFNSKTCFNLEFGIISKIISVNQLGKDIYECEIEGKVFCQIINEEVCQNSDQHEDFFYRVCEAKAIYQRGHIDSKILNEFLQKFSKLSNQKCLKQVYKQVSYENLHSKSNSIVCFYSILKIIQATNEKKYEVLTCFDNAKRQSFLKEFLDGINFDVNKNPDKFLSLSGIQAKAWIYFVIFFLILTFFLLSFTSFSQFEL